MVLKSANRVASIVIPALNAASFVGHALSAAMLQTEQNSEIIVVDDGSTDQTAEVVERAAARDERVRLIRNETPRGPSAARNAALDIARGDWVILLDADDMMEPDRIRRLRLEAEGRGLDALADNLTLVEEVTERPLGVALDPRLMANTAPLTLQSLLRADWPGRNCAYRSLGLAKPVIRRSFLENAALRYDETVRLGEDLLLYAGLIASGGRMGVTGETLYRYTVRSGSTSNRSAPTTELVEVNRKIAKLARDKGISDQALVSLLRDREAALRFQVLTWALRAGQVRKAAEVLRGFPPLALGRLSLAALQRKASTGNRGHTGGQGLLRCS